MPCSNAAKTQNPLKFVGVPQTPEPISAVSGPKFTILSGRVEQVLLFNKFFSDCQYMPELRRYTRQSCAMVPRWQNYSDFLGPAFPASRVQHISDLHLKFALRPHFVWKYMADIQSATAEIRRGKKERKIEEETTG